MATAASATAPAATSGHPKISAKVEAHRAPKLDAKELAKRAAQREVARIAAMKELAPGDEYFGPLKQSIIGIRNTIRDLGLRYDVNHDIGSQTYASAQLTERSIRDWQKRYPKDDQLPRAIFFLQRLYTKVLTQASRDRAKLTANWLETDFKRTPQAKQLAKTLAVEHLAPIPAPTASPAPATSYPSEFGSSYPSEFASSPSATPSATPSPAASAPPRH